MLENSFVRSVTILLTEAAVCRCSIEKRPEEFTGKYLCQSLFIIQKQILFIIKKQACCQQIYPKRDFNTGVFLYIFRYFSDHLFIEHLRMAAPEES